MSGQRNIRLLLADVDGTLVTRDKVLTEAAKAAARELHDAGIGLAITSGRPPRGMSMLIEPLALRTAIAGFNGGVLVNPDLSQGLPAFLTADPGLCSGFMMVQISAASLVAESRALAMPASIGSIPTDANQEDFVPMGMAAAWKAQRILANAQRVVAAELLCAAQGLELLLPLRPGRGVGRLHRALRRLDPPVLPLGADRPPAPDLERLAAAIRRGDLDPGEAR